MQPAIHKRVLLAGAIAVALAITMAAPTCAFARPHPKPKEKARRIAHKLAHKPPVKHATLAVTYTGESSKQALNADHGFWLNGGSLDGALTFNRGIGLAANLSVVHGGTFSNGGSIGKTTIVFGPRYTRDTTDWMRKGKWIKKGDWFKKAPRSQVYLEALFGIAHGFDGGFPENDTIASSANSIAVQLGAGLDVMLSRHFGARLMEVDYIHTGLPNGAANSQNDLRLSVGLTYHFDAPVAAIAIAAPAASPQP